MAAQDEVTLWRAPSPSCCDPSREVLEGYAADEYPGHGPYLATEEGLALEFADCYGRGLQELHLPRARFEEMVKEGVIQPDTWYPEGQAWHVPPEGLEVFNASIKAGTPNLYHPPAF